MKKKGSSLSKEIQKEFSKTVMAKKPLISKKTKNSKFLEKKENKVEKNYREKDRKFEEKKEEKIKEKNDEKYEEKKEIKEELPQTQPTPRSHSFQVNFSKDELKKCFENTPKNAPKVKPEEKKHRKRPSIEEIDVWKKQKELKEKNNAEIRRNRSLKELSECTFKPLLSTKMHENLIFHKKHNSSKSELTINPENCGYKKRNESQVILSPYSQLTPANLEVKYQSGFNSKDFFSRAKPLMAYSIV